MFCQHLGLFWIGVNKMLADLALSLILVKLDPTRDLGVRASFLCLSHPRLVVSEGISLLKWV